MGVMRIVQYAAIAAAATVLATGPGAARADDGKFQHALVLGGGGESDWAIFERIVELAGGTKNAKVGMITAAADGGRHTAHWRAYQQMFKSMGVEVHWLPVHDDNRQAAYDPDVVKLASEMNVVFFSGGSQNRLLRNVQDRKGRDTPLLAAIRKNFNARKTIVVGSSAGTASQAQGPVITAGESFEALTRPSVPTTDLYNGDNLSYNPRGGLGFFPWAVDTHFSERGREGRFVRFASETGADLAFGIDEPVSLFLLDPLDPARRTIEVVGGPGGVSIFDLKDATVDDTDGWAIDDVEMSHMSEGDVFDPRSRGIKFARWKSRARRQPATRPVRHALKRLRHDVFGSPRVSGADHDDPAVDSYNKDDSRKNISVLRTLGFAIARGDAAHFDGTAWEPTKKNRRVKVSLRRGQHTLAVEGKHHGPRRSFTGLRMNIRAGSAAPRR